MITCLFICNNTIQQCRLQRPDKFHVTWNDKEAKDKSDANGNEKKEENPPCNEQAPSLGNNRYHDIEKVYFNIFEFVFRIRMEVNGKYWVDDIHTEHSGIALQF